MPSIVTWQEWTSKTGGRFHSVVSKEEKFSFFVFLLSNPPILAFHTVLILYLLNIITDSSLISIFFSHEMPSQQSLWGVCRPLLSILCGPHRDCPVFHKLYRRLWVWWWFLIQWTYMCSRDWVWLLWQWKNLQGTVQHQCLCKKKKNTP